MLCQFFGISIISPQICLLATGELARWGRGRFISRTSKHVANPERQAKDASLTYQRYCTREGKCLVLGPRSIALGTFFGVLGNVIFGDISCIQERPF